MKQVLFLCTGNYYRSRLAETYFNHLARQEPAAGWQARSRGLQITPGNIGPLSPHTRSWLTAQKIPLADPLGVPTPVKEADFWNANHIVAVKEAEHRPLMEKYFPHWAERVEYWHVHDLDAATPEDAIPGLVDRVQHLYERLQLEGQAE